MMKELFTGLTAVNISPENALAIVEAFDNRFKEFEESIGKRFEHMEEKFDKKFDQLRAEINGANVKIGVMEGRINFITGLLVATLLAALGAIAKQIF